MDMAIVVMDCTIDLPHLTRVIIRCFSLIEITGDIILNDRVVSKMMHVIRANRGARLGSLQNCALLLEGLCGAVDDALGEPELLFPMGLFLVT